MHLRALISLHPRLVRYIGRQQSQRITLLDLRQRRLRHPHPPLRPLRVRIDRPLTIRHRLRDQPERLVVLVPVFRRRGPLPLRRVAPRSADLLRPFDVRDAPIREEHRTRFLWCGVQRCRVLVDRTSILALPECLVASILRLLRRRGERCHWWVGSRMRCEHLREALHVGALDGRVGGLDLRAGLDGNEGRHSGDAVFGGDSFLLVDVDAEEDDLGVLGRKTGVEGCDLL
jgi:hypothetical protein